MYFLSANTSIYWKLRPKKSKVSIWKYLTRLAIHRIASFSLINFFCQSLSSLPLTPDFKSGLKKRISGKVCST